MQHAWVRMALTVEQAVEAIEERFGITLNCWHTNNFWSFDLKESGLVYQYAADKSIKINFNEPGKRVISFSIVSDDNYTRAYKLPSRQSFEESVLFVLRKTTVGCMDMTGVAMLERIVGLL